MSFTVDNISKSFGDVRALDQVSFKTGDGELFGLIGPDGAGKTTLFRILVTLLLPDSGQGLVKGMDVAGSPRQIRRIMGYMPGRFSLYPDLSVKENLEFYATVFGTTVSEQYEFVKPIYSHIEPFEDRLAGRLSGGMKQKLALSCALIHRPEVLVLDEPTTGVDALSRSEFWEMLRGIKAQGITILVSTPYMDEATLCDRVALIQKGRILSVTEPADLQLPDGMKAFSFRASGKIHAYLHRLRELDSCHSAYLFGNEIHLVVTGDSDAQGLQRILSTWNIPGMILKEIKPGVEDIFMELMKSKEA
ncbi:MAG: ABC transporter ATP-binding protein [Bacteroidales bacterium]